VAGAVAGGLSDDWQRIVAAGNLPPPMGLRVNVRQATRDDYFARLRSAGIEARAVGECGLALARPVAVDSLPGFAEGLVSVQDPGAQRAAELLAPAPGSRVLDACAAPGGKTAHLLERADLDLLALDLKASRCRRIEENLARLHARRGQGGRLRQTRYLVGWPPLRCRAGRRAVPASGVVRRNPDAKWLRREADIASFAAAQARILDALWQVVQPGGKLLYATCSVFPAENGQQIERFLARRPQARRCHEEQLLPTAEHDGFFTACLKSVPDHRMNGPACLQAFWLRLALLRRGCWRC
jgi:16S rRNA (cytosine967-C5)-methyltransferase